MRERPPPNEQLTGAESEAEWEGRKLADQYQEKKSAEELADIEKEQQEALRLEKEVDRLAQDMAEFWKKDDGRALRFKNEESPQLRDGNEQYYDAVRAEHDKILDALQAKLVEMYQALAKVQEGARERFNDIARLLGRSERYTRYLKPGEPDYDARDKYKPVSEELGPAYHRAEAKKGTKPVYPGELLKSRFPFIDRVYEHGKQIYVDEGRLLQHYGYTDRGAQGKFARQKAAA